MVNRICRTSDFTCHFPTTWSLFPACYLQNVGNILFFPSVIFLLELILYAEGKVKILRWSHFKIVDEKDCLFDFLQFNSFPSFQWDIFINLVISSARMALPEVSSAIYSIWHNLIFHVILYVIETTFRADNFRADLPRIAANQNWKLSFTVTRAKLNPYNYKDKNSKIDTWCHKLNQITAFLCFDKSAFFKYKISSSYDMISNNTYP